MNCSDRHKPSFYNCQRLNASTWLRGWMVINESLNFRLSFITIHHETHECSWMSMAWSSYSCFTLQRNVDFFYVHFFQDNFLIHRLRIHYREGEGQLSIYMSANAALWWSEQKHSTLTILFSFSIHRRSLPSTQCLPKKNTHLIFTHFQTGKTHDCYTVK